jgi:hypothetical protein
MMPISRCLSRVDKATELAITTPLVNKASAAAGLERLQRWDNRDLGGVVNINYSFVSSM